MIEVVIHGHVTHLLEQSTGLLDLASHYNFHLVSKVSLYQIYVCKI